jgi:hypothetical protein
VIQTSKLGKDNYFQKHADSGATRHASTLFSNLLLGKRKQRVGAIYTIGWTIKLVSFFFKESNFQIVRVFCATKIFFLIFDTFKKKPDQLYGPPYIYRVARQKSEHFR